MVPAGNKAKHLSSVNHITKTIHHHDNQFVTYVTNEINKKRSLLGT